MRPILSIGAQASIDVYIHLWMSASIWAIDRIGRIYLISYFLHNIQIPVTGVLSYYPGRPRGNFWSIPLFYLDAHMFRFRCPCGASWPMHTCVCMSSTTGLLFCYVYIYRKVFNIILFFCFVYMLFFGMYLWYGPSCIGAATAEMMGLSPHYLNHTPDSLPPAWRG